MSEIGCITVYLAHRWENPIHWWRGTPLVSLRILGAERVTSGQGFGPELCLHITTWMNGCVTLGKSDSFAFVLAPNFVDTGTRSS